MLLLKQKVSWMLTNTARTAHLTDQPSVLHAGHDAAEHGCQHQHLSAPRFTIFTHSHTDGGISHARRQPARREQLGWVVLLRDTLTLATSNLLVISQPALTSWSSCHPIIKHCSSLFSVFNVYWLHFSCSFCRAFLYKHVYRRLCMNKMNMNLLCLGFIISPPYSGQFWFYNYTDCRLTMLWWEVVTYHCLFKHKHWRESQVKPTNVL